MKDTAEDIAAFAPPTRDRDAMLSAYVTEYGALRDEIGWLIEGANQYQNFSIALIAAYVGLIASKDVAAGSATVYVHLFIPLILSLLGFLHFRQHEEVYVVARCIEHEIVPRIRVALGVDDVFVWERYKASNDTGVKPASRAIHLLRLLLFIVPSAISLGAAYSWINPFFSDDRKFPAFFLQSGLLFAGTLAVLGFSLYAYMNSRLPETLRKPPALPGPVIAAAAEATSDHQ